MNKKSLVALIIIMVIVGGVLVFLNLAKTGKAGAAAVIVPQWMERQWQSVLQAFQALQRGVYQFLAAQPRRAEGWKTPRVDISAGIETPIGEITITPNGIRVTPDITRIITPFITPQKLCTESDSNPPHTTANPYQKGTTTDQNGSATDYCESSTVLREYYCNPANLSQKISVTINCAYEGKICDDGACKVGCTDTDPPNETPRTDGIRYWNTYVKGTANGYDESGGSASGTDKCYIQTSPTSIEYVASCDQSTLSSSQTCKLDEYYCDGRIVKNGGATCSRCSNGMCLLPNESSCIDNDGGVNVLQASSAVGPSGVQNQGLREIAGEDLDKCGSRTVPGPGYSIYYDCCIDSQTSNYLKEAICSSGSVAYTQVNCVYGCQNGACKSPPPTTPPPSPPPPSPVPSPNR